MNPLDKPSGILPSRIFRDEASSIPREKLGIVEKFFKKPPDCLTAWRPLCISPELPARSTPGSTANGRRRIAERYPVK